LVSRVGTRVGFAKATALILGIGSRWRGLQESQGKLRFGRLKLTRSVRTTPGRADVSFDHAKNRLCLEITDDSPQEALSRR